MKKLLAFLLCLLTVLSFVACDREDVPGEIPSAEDLSNQTPPPSENTTDQTPPSENTTDQTSPAGGENPDPDTPSDELLLANARAKEAYAAVIWNERKMYYPSRREEEKPSEIYLEKKETYLDHIYTASQYKPNLQAMVDMDGDGIDEMILSYYTYYTNDYIILHFENNDVYGFDEEMGTIYSDGSFSWSCQTPQFGYEYGISRMTFVNGLPKYQELCRVEGDTNFYLDGTRVTEEQYQAYMEENERTPVSFVPFDISLLDENEARALALAEAYWGIKDGDFNENTGCRYRVICHGKRGDEYQISLYYFEENTYYEHLEAALVNIETGTIWIDEYPDGKG